MKILNWTCENVRKSYAQYFGKNQVDSRRGMGNFALIKTLQDPWNKRGFKQLSDDISPTPGKEHTVLLEFKHPVCFSVCEIGEKCHENTAPLVLQNGLVEIPMTKRLVPCDAQGNELVITFTNADLNSRCKDDDFDWMFEKIDQAMTEFVRQIDKWLVNGLRTMKGCYENGTQTKSIKLFTPQVVGGSENINASAWFTIDANAQDNAGEDQYIILGRDSIRKTLQYQKVQCCSISGIDLSLEESPRPMAFDNNFAPTEFYQLARGAVQLVTRKEYVGSREINSDTVTQVVLPERETAFPVNVKILYDPKCESYEVYLSAYTQLVVAAPGAGCNELKSCVNGVFEWKDCSEETNSPLCAATCTLELSSLNAQYPINYTLTYPSNTITNTATSAANLVAQLVAAGLSSAILNVSGDVEILSSQVGNDCNLVTFAIAPPSNTCSADTAALVYPYTGGLSDTVNTITITAAADLAALVGQLTLGGLTGISVTGTVVTFNKAPQNWNCALVDFQ